MATNDDIHADLYDRNRAVSEEVKELVGQVKMLVKQNDDLIGLLRKALCYMFWIIVFLIGAIVYGAIGKDGLYSVRPKNLLTMATDIITPPDNRFFPR